MIPHFVMASFVSRSLAFVLHISYSIPAGRQVKKAAFCRSRVAACPTDCHSCEDKRGQAFYFVVDAFQGSDYAYSYALEGGAGELD